MRTNEAVSQLHKNRKVSTLFRLIYSFIAHRAPKTHTHTSVLWSRCWYRKCDNITLIRFHEQFCACFDIQNSSSLLLRTLYTQALLYHKHIENCAWKSMILVIFSLFFLFLLRFVSWDDVFLSNFFVIFCLRVKKRVKMRCLMIWILDQKIEAV